MNQFDEFVFHDDVHSFEPNETLSENFLFWFKIYMSDKFGHLTIRTVKDKNLHKEYVLKINSLDTMDDIKDLINAMSRNGVKGPKTYFNPNNRFYDFLIKYNQKNLKTINTNMFKHFLLNELDELSSVHKKNIYGGIRNFLSFIEEHNNTKGGDSHSFNLHKDIAKVIPKESKKIAYLSPTNEYYKFFETIDKIPWTKKTIYRNRFMLKILLVTGIRVHELTTIKISDLNEVEKDNSLMIKIIGKGNKHRSVRIGLDMISEELGICKAYSKSVNSKFIFSTDQGNSVNDRYLNTIIPEVMLAAGIAPKDKNSAHMLRHSCCTWLSTVAGFDIAKLQAYMGHEDIATTKKYLHINDEVVKDMSIKAEAILGDSYNEFKEARV